MDLRKTLFDDILPEDSGMPSEEKKKTSKKEVTGLERLKNLEEKIAIAVEKVKSLKAEKSALEARVRELENALREKTAEIEAIRSEKSAIKGQIEDLLNELDTIEIG